MYGVDSRNIKPLKTCTACSLLKTDVAFESSFETIDTKSYENDGEKQHYRLTDQKTLFYNASNKHLLIRNQTEHSIVNDSQLVVVFCW